MVQRVGRPNAAPLQYSAMNCPSGIIIFAGLHSMKYEAGKDGKTSATRHRTIDAGHQSWMTSRAANVGFILGSWSAIATSIGVVVLALIAPPRTFNADELYGRQYTFLVIFALIAMLVVLQWYLWLSMLWFLFRRARLPLRVRLIWFLVVFFGVSLGAGLFYLFAWHSANPVGKTSDRVPTST